MPWSGSGVYTRGYASWTADASNGLPISATKFDTEDNDFAAGIQNCLTIDNQNKPNQTLTWAQALNLTKGSDANVFSIARTGGTNNPSLTWSLQDSANTVTARLVSGNALFVFGTGSYTFGNVTDNPTMTFTGSAYTFNSSVTGGTPGFIVASGKSATTAGADLEVTRAGSTINSIGEGPCLELMDTTNSTNSLLQQSGGQTELWQFNGGAWKQIWIVTAQDVFELSDNAASPSFFPVGYLGLPQNSQAANYTTVLADRAKQITHNSPSAHTYTIPANASVAYSIGDVLHFVNPPSGGALTIAITSDTLTLVPTGTTGSRTLLAPGVATAEKIAATSWIIYGSNLS